MLSLMVVGNDDTNEAQGKFGCQVRPLSLSISHVRTQFYVVEVAAWLACCLGRSGGAQPVHPDFECHRSPGTFPADLRRFGNRAGLKQICCFLYVETATTQCFLLLLATPQATWSHTLWSWCATLACSCDSVLVSGVHARMAASRS
jgi:hypothetical protein